jgi:hypothetical protein
LLDAQNPRIAVGRLRTPEGVNLAVQLAELVGASTDSAATQGPMSFPQGHRLYGPGANTSYDYTLGLEAPAATVALIAPSLSTLLDRDVTNIGFGGIAPGVGGNRGRGNAPAGRTIPVDAEASLTAIVEQVRRQMSPDKQRVVAERSAKHAEANQRARIDALTRAFEQKRAGWDASPIATARIYCRAVAAPSKRGLDPFIAQQFLRGAQHAALDSRQAVQLSRRTRCRWHGVRCAGVGWGSAGGEEPRTNRHQRADGWRSELRARGAVDGPASSASDADRDA